MGTLSLSSTAYAVPENAGAARLTVIRAQGSRGTVTVNYTAAPLSATPGVDYAPVSGTLIFPDGVTSQTIVVPVLPNSLDNHDESLQIVLSAATPAGGAILGSPSAATLTIQDIDPDVTPPTVRDVTWAGSSRNITQVFVTFTEPVLPSTATDLANYRLVNVGRDGRYGTRDDKKVLLTALAYDPATLTAALSPAAPLPANQFFSLQVNGSSPGGIEDLAGNVLAGNGRTAHTDYTALIARGTNLRVHDAGGDLVSLQITRGGFLDDLVDGYGQGKKLIVVGAVPHRSVLSGTVKRGRKGDGKAFLCDRIDGLGRAGDVRIRLSWRTFRVNHVPYSS